MNNLINILYQGIPNQTHGIINLPLFGKQWIYQSYQTIYKYVHKQKISLQTSKLQTFILIQQKRLYQCAHFNTYYHYFVLNNHWSINLNFCMPYQKKIKSIQQQINHIILNKDFKQFQYIISGYTLSQILLKKPIQQIQIVLYIVSLQNLRLKTSQFIQVAFGSDNYYHIKTKKFKSIKIYRNYFKTLNEGVVYMNLNIFYINGKTYCRPTYLQEKGLFNILQKIQLEVPIEVANRPPKVIKYFPKQDRIFQIYYRKFAINNYCIKQFSAKWDRCYICKNISSKIKIFKNIQVDFNRSQQTCDYHKYKQDIYLNLKTNLEGKYALVTGGRVKIGYAIVLRLLRNGAKVFAMTRYPHLALMNYQKQKDYQQFKDKLVLIRCDLTNIPYLTMLLKKLKQQILSIRGQNQPIFDILINNACHTVAPPAKFYELANKAEQILSMSITSQKKENNKQSQLIKKQESQTIQYLNCKQLKLIQTKQLDIKINHFHEIDFKFQQKNSWNKTLSQLSVQQILMANLINQIAPTLIIRQLIQNHQCNLQNKYNVVINVTSSQGYFRAKDDAHIHTNMAKASLDMLSFSLHEATLKYNNRKYVYSVDPGFVSSVVVDNAPLSSQQGASRIFHPIYCVNQQKPLQMYRYKDYKPKKN